MFENFNKDYINVVYVDGEIVLMFNNDFDFKCIYKQEQFTIKKEQYISYILDDNFITTEDNGELYLFDIMINDTHKQILIQNTFGNAISILVNQLNKNKIQYRIDKIRCYQINSYYFVYDDTSICFTNSLIDNILNKINDKNLYYIGKLIDQLNVLEYSSINDLIKLEYKILSKYSKDELINLCKISITNNICIYDQLSKNGIKYYNKIKNKLENSKDNYEIIQNICIIQLFLGNDLTFIYQAYKMFINHEFNV